MTLSTKRCTKCGVEKPRASFSVDSSKALGLKSWCKTCMVESAKASAKRNPDKVRKHQRAWKKRNPDKIRAQGKIDKRRSYKRPGEKMRADVSRYYAENREAIAARRATPEGRRKRVIAQQRREARKRNQGGSGVTRAQWEEVLEDHDHACAYCGSDGPLHMDHVTPISRGGSHDASNVVPACQPCNSSKNDRTVEEWIGYGHGRPELSTMKGTE